MYDNHNALERSVVSTMPSRAASPERRQAAAAALSARCSWTCTWDGWMEQMMKYLINDEKRVMMNDDGTGDGTDALVMELGKGKAECAVHNVLLPYGISQVLRAAKVCCSVGMLQHAVLMHVQQLGMPGATTGDRLLQAKHTHSPSARITFLAMS